MLVTIKYIHICIYTRMFIYKRIKIQTNEIYMDKNKWKTTDNNKNHNNNNNNERLLDVAAFLSFWPRGPWRASAQPCLQLRADHGCKINGVPDSFYSLYCFYIVAFSFLLPMFY